MISGINDDQVTFTATQNGRELHKIQGVRDKVVALGNRGSADIQLCWEKSDRKSKKINFNILEAEGDLDAKATGDTVENL